ncbi:FlaD/FlaE family flagellar protein [Natrialba taiwanensis]|uniref:Flagella accessory C family protein n=1 Tax=Natrialba taiwanensis DSM 12281 TaxID=1230458 RepID=L9ZW63_9EURY|nr:FlaD/FlaE family flagellar protein [Natrialba taiwanensis]ELY89398.1 Flagella accessory C family protein [Natrialba taiwanensis DSM 12281]
MTLLLFSELGGGDEPDPDEDEDDLLGSDDGLIGDDLGFDGDDSDGSDDTEFTYRLDEIEKEVDSLENQVETVRGENEQISESITTVEQNVDKLVEMYEIVTQGINPFVGDQELGNAFETAAGQGGVFGGEDDPADDIDDDIINSEAEDFLDDDLDDGLDDDLDDDLDTDLDDDTDDEFSDGFEEVDEEGDEDEFGETLDAEADFEDDLELDADAEFESESPADLGSESDTASVVDDSDEKEEEAVVEETALDPDAEEAADTDGTAGDTAVTEADPILEGTNGEVGDLPYLVRHPARNDAELATLEWVQFLVNAAGITGAAQTIAYYESVEWISTPVATYLHTLLNGFGDGSSDDGAAPTPPEYDDLEPKSVLSNAEHKRSLQYIAGIATPEATPPSGELGREE